MATSSSDDRLPDPDRSIAQVRADLFDPAFLGRVEQLALLARRMVTSGAQAHRRSKKIGSGLEFAEHRDYSAGDDMAQLDWALLARSDQVQIREYEEEEDLSVYFLVDHSQSMAVGAEGEISLLDRALQIAAALGYISLSNLDRVSVVPFAQGAGAPMRAVRGRGQFFAVLRTLSAVKPAGKTDIRKAIDDFVRHQPRPGLVVLISDFFDPSGLGDALSLLAYRGFEPMLLHLCDLQLLQAGAYGDVTLVDSETGELCEITLTPALMADYRKAFAAFSADLERAARQVAARCLQLDVAVPFDEAVLKVFRQGGFLG
ncbi:MAG: DUF58 domain-containing protein [Deltaproteobacteria bacterium]|nr:DUF58 domain-containing protein [Deltaproteobacteria bacterium]